MLYKQILYKIEKFLKFFFRTSEIRNFNFMDLEKIISFTINILNQFLLKIINFFYEISYTVI